MNTTEFHVWFQHGDHTRYVVVYTFSEQEAKILAQAERIKGGLTYEVLRVEAIKKERW
jgi:hypothetical protein